MNTESMMNDGWKAQELSNNISDSWGKLSLSLRSSGSELNESKGMLPCLTLWHSTWDMVEAQ